MVDSIRSLGLPALLQRIAEHETCRPEIPRGLAADDPAFIEWHQAFTKWCNIKNRMESSRNVRDQDYTAKKKKRRADSESIGAA